MNHYETQVSFLSDEIVNAVISLIHSALSKKPSSLFIDNELWEKVYSVGMYHQILPLLYYGIVYSKYELSAELMEKIKRNVYYNAIQCEKQAYEVRQIFDAFEENKIEYIPLKGLVMQKFYQHPEMRLMGDADVLVKIEQVAQVSTIMKKLGYVKMKVSDHNIEWTRPSALPIEIHIRMVPRFEKEYYSCLGEGWQFALSVDKKSYERIFSDSDLYVYLFVHMARHYRGGGIGLRHMIDIWVCLHSLQIDFKYVEACFQNMRLLVFYHNVIETLNVWFKHHPSDDVSNLITIYVFCSGTFGREEDRLYAQCTMAMGSNKSIGWVRLNRVFHLVFLPFSKMKEKYTYLERFPILIPLAHFTRWTTAIFCKSANIKKQINDLQKMQSEKIMQYRNDLERAGLFIN